VITWASSAILLVMVQESPEADQENSGHEDSSSWWQGNSAVIIAILSVVVVAIRLLSVSRGDPQIAYAILQSGGTGNVLIGTLVSTVGLLAIPASAVFAVFWYDAYIGSKKSNTRPGESEPGPGESPFPKKHVLLAATLTAAYIAIYTAPIGGLITIGLIIGAVQGYNFRKTSRWRWDLAEAKTILSIFAVAYIALVVLLEVANPTPWLPIQTFSVEGQAKFSGYTLSQADGNTFILTSNPDEVISVPSQRIQATTQCTPRHYIEEQATVVYVIERLLNNLPKYHACLAARYSQNSSSLTPSHSPTPTPSPTPSHSPTPTPSPTPSHSPTPTPSPTPPSRAGRA
jgi:hypothetical protein